MSTEFITIHNNNDLHSYFKSAFITFEDKNIELENLPINNAKFGILNFNAVHCLPTSVEHEFIFVIDNSGSMTDLCSDKRSKMQHIIHTLKKMVLYFKENSDIKVNISIFTFDDHFYNVVDRTDITKEKLPAILNKIDNILPNGSTNIELALKKINKYISDLKYMFPTNQINHIFMTDGEITSGDSNHDNILQLVDNSIYNVFVGFGVNHDSNLLNLISCGNKSSYYFIDEIEKSGLVYGEILHSLLYKMIYDVEICITNGFIYNYISNLWTNILYIGDITGETNKNYHIISRCPNECNVLIQCKKNINDNINTLSFNITNNMNLIDFINFKPINFDNYVFRQKTLQMLYEAKKCQQDKIKYYKYINHIDYIIDNFNTGDDFINSKQNQDDNIEEKCICIKKKMLELLFEMKKYMIDNNMRGDSFITNLCNDLYISHKTFDTQFGAMFINARQTSQGTQRCYNVYKTPDLYDNNSYQNINRISPPKLFRHLDKINNNNLDNLESSPYLTPTATKIMYSFSENTSDEAQFNFYLSDDDDDEHDTISLFYSP